MGLGAVFAPPGTYPIQSALSERRLGGDGPPQQAATPEADEWLRSSGDLPLMYQPGEMFAYHTGSNVLGVLIARLTGQSLESVLRQRVFEALGMTDSAFWVPADKRPRLATSYDDDAETGALAVFDSVDDSQWGLRRRSPPAAEASAGRSMTTWLSPACC